MHFLQLDPVPNSLTICKVNEPPDDNALNTVSPTSKLDMLLVNMNNLDCENLDQVNILIPSGQVECDSSFACT